MERIRAKKLPPIFKMSVLCNILPYYGNLHRWRRLLEKINTKTKEIWDQNREQLMFVGRDFRRDIELDKLKKITENLIPNRGWLDLFSLSLSDDIRENKFDFTNLIDNLSEDEVIIIDSHDDIFKAYQIHYCSKDRISDILPAIKCPSFKSESKIFKFPELNKIGSFIYYQNHTKSIAIENAGDKISINLVFGETVKIMPGTFDDLKPICFLKKLKERYSLCEIDDCACKPKKIRAQEREFGELKYAIEELEKISNIIDVKFGMNIDSKKYYRTSSNFDSMVFNHSARCMRYKNTNFIFRGNELAAVYKGNYYKFRLDQRTMESKYSYIKGKIIENKSKNYFALYVTQIRNLQMILKEEVKNSKNKKFIDSLKEISTQKERCFIVFYKKGIDLKINIHEVKTKMPKQEFYSTVDVKINNKIESEDIICMLEHIPNHLTIRLEADKIEHIFKLMKNKKLIEKLKEQRTKFVHKGIIIQPKIIENRMNEKDLKNRVKEMKAKIDRLNMDCDK